MPITGAPNPGTEFGFRKLCLVHWPAAGTLPDADTAGIPGGAGRRPPPAGRRPPGQVPACQALPDLACRDSAGSESLAATRPSSCALVACSIPQGDSNGGITAPPLRRFKKGPGGKHRVPAAAQGSAEANCPEGAKEAPLGDRAGKGRSSGRSEPAPFGQRRGTGSLQRRRPSRNVLWKYGGVFLPFGRNTPHRRRAFARLQPSRPPGRKSLCLRRRQSSHFTGWYSSPAPAPSQQRPLPSRPGPRWSSYRGDSW